MSVRMVVASALVLGLATASAAAAQSAAADPRPIEQPLELEPYVGIARHSPVGQFLGETPDRNHLFVGLHVTAAVARWRSLTVAYAPEALLIVLSDNPTYVVETFTTSRGTGTFARFTGVAPVAGFAASPVGFEGRIRVADRWRVYAATAGGFVMFTRATPDIEERRFNYTLEFGGGVDLRIHAEWWLRAGYKFHHFSNAFSALENPGVDANVFVVGVGHGVGKR
jgi:hypothetical protein